MFGGTIDGENPGPDIIAVLGRPGLTGIPAAMELASREPDARAFAVAQLDSFRGRAFAPLAEQFGVSPTAMGIQLLEAGLVK
jgi:hypothetical protein